MIIRDLLRRNELIKIAETLGEEIMGSYSAEHDKTYHNLNTKQTKSAKSAEKKLQRKLDSAITNAAKTFSVAVSREKLGVYGKSKVCKELQDYLVNNSYSNDTAVYIIRRLLPFSSGRKKI